MSMLGFLKPPHLGWVLRNLREVLVDRLKGAPPRPEQARAYVEANATRGDPASVLATLDDFARNRRFLMNVGPEKGQLLEAEVDRAGKQARILEVGCYCGYSAILMARRLGEEGRITSLEKSGTSVAAARSIIDFAGLSGAVEVRHGPSSELIPRLEGNFDLVFLDHWKDLYEPDLRAIEAAQLIRPGSVVFADNVGSLFDPKKYLAYVRECGRYESRSEESHIEYSKLPDCAEISTFLG
ncbi:MAG: class I SAM-dependent methyltransferase [Myxococcota bacterium]